MRALDHHLHLRPVALVTLAVAAIAGGLALPDAASVATAAPLVPYIEVTADCTLDEAIRIVNESANHRDGCNDFIEGGSTTTIRITPNSGTATLPATGETVPGVQVDLATPLGSVVGGARSAFSDIKKPMTIEGVGDARLGIYATELPGRAQTCVPVIVSSSPLQIEMQCTSDASQPYGARFFDVTSTGALTLRDLNIVGGSILGADAQPPATACTLFQFASGNCPSNVPAGSARGGAIYADGPVTLDGVTMYGNSAVGGAGRGLTLGGTAEGGAIYTTSTLTVTGSLFRGNIAGGGTSAAALGGDVRLGTTASATISDTVFVGSVAYGGDGVVGTNGSDGADGRRGANGVCDDGNWTRADGAQGRQGVQGTDGTNGGDGGDAVGVISGGSTVSIDHSAIIDATARAGAAGLGGVGGIGGDGGRGGDSISCSKGSKYQPFVWAGTDGLGGFAGENGLIGTPGDRGRAVATIDVGTRLDLADVTIGSATAIVPDDLVPGGETLAQWITRRANALQTVGLHGATGSGTGHPVVNVTSNGSTDGTVFAREHASTSGLAVTIEPDQAAVAAISSSTIADSVLTTPTSAVVRPVETARMLIGAAGAVPLPAALPAGLRGNILWNPGAASAPCPFIGSRSTNVHDGGCFTGVAGDRLVTTRPMAASVTGVGAIIRPGVSNSDAAVRMPVYVLPARSAAINMAPADPVAPFTCVRVDGGAFGTGADLADDARRDARDARCDAGAYEFSGDDTQIGLISWGPTQMFKGDTTPTEAFVQVFVDPGANSTLTISVDGLDDVAFPTSMTRTGNDGNPQFSEATLTFDGTQPFPLTLTLPMLAGLDSASTATVHAQIDGTPLGTVANPNDVTLQVYDDRQLDVWSSSPAEWSPCRGYLPITFHARSIGHLDAPAASVRLWPNLVQLNANGLRVPPGQSPTTPPLLYPTGGSTVSVNAAGEVTWNVPSIGAGDPQPTVTMYLAIGGLDPSQVQYLPGTTVQPNAQITYPGGNPADYSPVGTPAFPSTAIVNDLELLSGLITDTPGQANPDLHLSAGETRSGGRALQVSLDALDSSCLVPSNAPYFWTPIEMTVYDPESATPDTPILSTVTTSNLSDGSPGDNWFTLPPFTVPPTAGTHHLRFVFDGPGSDPVSMLAPYEVDPQTMAVVGPALVAPAASTNESSATRTFQVRLARTFSTDVTVDWTTFDLPANAVGGTDYVPASGTIVIPRGTRIGSFTVNVTDDALSEPDETFGVRIAENPGSPLPAGLDIAVDEALGDITNDDLGLSVADASVAEGNSGTTSLTFTITSPAPPLAACTVGVSTVLSGSAGAADLTPLSAQQVTIPAGGAVAVPVTVSVQGDLLDEDDEDFVLQLTDGTTNGCGTAALVDASATGTILDDDTATVSIGDASVTEGTGAGSTSLSFPVSLSTVATHPVTVVATTAPGSADASDFTATSQTVTIPAGATSATFSVPVTRDATIEVDESLSVTLSDPSGATIADGTAAGTIVDDDAWTVSGSATVTVTEGNPPPATSTVQIVFTLNSPAPAGGISFDWATVDGTAVAPSDYAAASGTATIPAGATTATVDVQIVNDTVHESTESFSVTVSNVRRTSGGSVPTLGREIGAGEPLVFGAGTAAVVTITDNDPEVQSQGPDGGSTTTTTTPASGTTAPPTTAPATAPTSTGPATTTAPVTIPTRSGSLPATGADVLRVLGIAAVLTVVGLVFRRTRRRRHLGA